jgi:hypothetical protein
VASQWLANVVVVPAATRWRMLAAFSGPVPGSSSATVVPFGCGLTGAEYVAAGRSRRPVRLPAVISREAGPAGTHTRGRSLLAGRPRPA